MDNMEEKKLVNRAMNDVWKLAKKYFDPQQDDAYWNALIHDGVAISEKYDRHPLIDAMVKDVVMWLDHKSGNDKWWRETT